jgi:DNA-binding NtrC family response regulator
VKVLIIEDDTIKATQVMAFLRNNGVSEIVHRVSYNSGLQAIRSSVFDFCVLDMSLPTFDVSPKDEGFESLPYAGDLLLREMMRRKVNLPTVILTQFTTFPEKVDEKTLPELAAELMEKYRENYLGAIFYADEETSWQSDMVSLIQKIKGRLC